MTDIELFKVRDCGDRPDIEVCQTVPGMHRETERSAECRGPPEPIQLLALLVTFGVRVLAGVQLDRFNAQLRGSADGLRIGVDEERGSDPGAGESAKCCFQSRLTCWREHSEPSFSSYLLPLLRYERNLIRLPTDREIHDFRGRGDLEVDRASDGG